MLANEPAVATQPLVTLHGQGPRSRVKTIQDGCLQPENVVMTDPTNPTNPTNINQHQPYFIHDDPTSMILSLWIFSPEESELWNRDLGKLRGMTWRAWSHRRDDIISFFPTKTQPISAIFFLNSVGLGSSAIVKVPGRSEQPESHCARFL